MNRKEKNPAGMILRAERIRQGKGQKEVCYGICVVSYLSKIERGSAEPDMAILKQLFARLGINYETDSAFLTESRKQDVYKRQDFSCGTAVCSGAASDAVWCK